MDRRLRYQKKTADFILIYYSLTAIILTLTVKYYPEYMSARWGEFWNLILSIVILTYSLINSSANYEQRIQNCRLVIAGINHIKRTVGSDQCNSQKIQQEYSDIVKKAEPRDDVDFFRTLKQQCGELDILWWKNSGDHSLNDEILKSSGENFKKLTNLKQHLSEVGGFMTTLKIAFGYLKDFFLFALPVIIFIIPRFWILFNLSEP